MRTGIDERADRAGTPLTAILFAVLLGTVAAQETVEGPFTNASMNGIYAFVTGLGAAPDSPAPNNATWLVVSYNGDGTADILTIGSNDLGEDGEVEAGARDADVLRPETAPRVTYEVSPDGILQVVGSAGDVLWDGLILRSEEIDGVRLATEYVLFHRQSDPSTGGLAVGRGFRQRPR